MKLKGAAVAAAADDADAVERGADADVEDCGPLPELPRRASLALPPAPAPPRPPCKCVDMFSAAGQRSFFTCCEKEMNGRRY